MALKLSVNVIFYIAFIYLSLFYFIQSSPVDSSISYENFMNDIKNDNCSFPPGVILPFQSNQTFEYLALPLGICKPSKELKLTQKVRTLCSEVFDTLKNITCHPYKRQNLPEIRVDFSDDVCQNISSLKSDPSLKNASLLKHLTDKFICDILCADDFLPACRVLLWSHQVQNLVEYLPHVQNEETPNKEIKTADFHEEIEDLPKISNNKSLTENMKPNVKNDGEKSNLDDEKNFALESNKDQQSSQTIKTNNILASIKDEVSIKPRIPEINENKVNIEVKVDDKSSGQIPPFPDENRVPTKNKNNTTLDAEKNKSTTKSIDTIDKETNRSNKIAATQETENKHEKKFHVVEEVKNSIKVNKIEEPHNTRNNIEEKDDAQPAIVPRILNEADKGKGKKQEIIKDKVDLGSKVLPTVGNNEKTSITNANLEKMEDDNGIPEPVDKDQDSYKDEDGFDEFSKNKKTDGDDKRIPNPADIANELPKYDGFPSKSIVGQGADDLPVISTFPEQEDSHFFFYFLSLVLILMGGYLLFHNKQKIIALIVEGRHERRRRSHGIGYKKLETK